MLCGREGWNQFLHDFAIEYPRCTNNFGPLEESDCGSGGWAFGLFIAWNILSMVRHQTLFVAPQLANLVACNSTSL